MGAAQVQNGVAASSSPLNQGTATAATTTVTHGVAASPSSALNQATSTATTTTATACEVSNAPKKKKICCACPDTKRLRDECIVENGEDACAKWIEAHRFCLRSEGFNV